MTIMLHTELNLAFSQCCWASGKASNP